MDIKLIKLKRNLLPTLYGGEISTNLCRKESNTASHYICYTSALITYVKFETATVSVHFEVHRSFPPAKYAPSSPFPRDTITHSTRGKHKFIRPKLTTRFRCDASGRFHSAPVLHFEDSSCLSAGPRISVRLMCLFSAAPRLLCTTFKVPARQSASNLSRLEINYARLLEMRPRLEAPASRRTLKLKRTRHVLRASRSSLNRDHSQRGIVLQASSGRFFASLFAIFRRFL